MPHPMKQAVRLLAVTATAAITALTVSAASAQELEAVKVMTPNDVSCSPYPQIAADEFGFFAEEGLKLELLSSDTNVPYIAFLKNGDADIVTLDSGMILQAVHAGQPISIVYEAYQRGGDGLVVLAEGDITSVADLKGKIVGMASDRDQLTTALALNSVGIDISEVTTVVVGDGGPAVAKAMLDGQIQAFAAAHTDFAGMEAGGLKLRNITPPAVSNIPGNTWAVWTPTIEEKRSKIERFLRAWAKGQHAGVMDTKAVMSACKKRIPEQWETAGMGESIVLNSVQNTQMRRTLKYGELQSDVWVDVQPPYVKFGEIPGLVETSKFIDASFIDAANAFTTDDVKKAVKAWKEANKDILIN